MNSSSKDSTLISSLAVVRVIVDVPWPLHTYVANVAHPNSVAQVSNFLCWQVDKTIQLEPLSIGRPIYFCCLSKCTYTVLFCGAFAAFAVHIQNLHWPKFTFNRDTKTPQQTAYLAIWRALVLHCAFISNTNIITSHLSSTKTTLNWFATIICATVLEETIPFAPPPTNLVALIVLSATAHQSNNHSQLKAAQKIIYDVTCNFHTYVFNSQSQIHTGRQPRAVELSTTGRVIRRRYAVSCHQF